MGFGSTEQESAETGQKNKVNGPSFGDQLLGQVLGGIGSGRTTPTPPPVTTSPQAQELPDYSQLIAKNAMPKQGGGLSELLKALIGGG